MRIILIQKLIECHVNSSRFEVQYPAIWPIGSVCLYAAIYLIISPLAWPIIIVLIYALYLPWYCVCIASCIQLDLYRYICLVLCIKVLNTLFPQCQYLRKFISQIINFPFTSIYHAKITYWLLFIHTVVYISTVLYIYTGCM